jgi:hypothetical protein
MLEYENTMRSVKHMEDATHARLECGHRVYVGMRPTQYVRCNVCERKAIAPRHYVYSKIKRSV